jgi:uncharacterized secreted protein with C-terminal beta-propeller domain
VVRPETLVDVTKRRSPNDGNNKRSTALNIITWNSVNGRQHNEQHHNEHQSRAGRDDVLIIINLNLENDKVSSNVSLVGFDRRGLLFYEKNFFGFKNKH